MEEEQLLSFYESVYKQELEYKETLMNRVQLTAALLLTNFSAFTYMLRNVDLKSGVVFISYFFLFAAINLIVIFTATYFVARAFSSTEYKSIPALSKINDYISEWEQYNHDIEAYNVDNNTNEPKVKIQEKLNEYLKKLYVECASFNAVANERRASFSYRGVITTIISYFPLLICASLFIIDDMDASSSRKPTDISAENIENQLKDINNSLHTILVGNISWQRPQNLHQSFQLNLQPLQQECSKKVTSHQSPKKKEKNNVCR